MKTVGESETYGREQEHLNNVFGARLRITSLHAQAGPGIELMGIAKRFLMRDPDGHLMQLIEK